MDKGLGRLYAPDSRDANHPMTAVLPDVPKVPRVRAWLHKGILDQGDTGTCVYHAWYSLRMGSPHRHPADPRYTPFDMYREGVLLDEWTQNDREATLPNEELQFGSSVRAGAKVAFRLGWVHGGYVWADTVDTAARHVALRGPVVMGTPWRQAMGRPTPEGFVTYTGPIRGGHAYVWDGVDFRRGVARFRNSWGIGWGVKGRFYMALEEVARMFAEDSEACAPVEVAA